MSKPPTGSPAFPGPEPIGKDKSLEGEKIAPPDREAFDSYMKEPQSASKEAPATTTTPMDLAGKGALASPSNYDTLLGQVNSARDSLGEIEKNMKTPKLQFKRSQEKLIGTKLQNANDHINTALTKMGVQTPPASPDSSAANPLTRFLGLITDGQNRLASAKSQLQSLSSQKKQLSPPDLLLIQVNLSQAQQEIEYSAILLNQVVSAIKQMFNIQL